MIKTDKRKYSICIVSKSDKDVFYKHLDNKKIVDVKTGQEKAIEEAQKLANKTGQKVTVLTSAFNVYPDNKERI